MDATTHVPKAAILTMAALLALLPMRAAHAQTRDHRLAFHGGLGWGQTWSDESRLGAGFSVEAGVEVLVLERLGLQFGVSGYSHDRTFESNVRFSGESLMFSGDCLYHFSGTRVQPFLLGGVALVKTRNRSSFPVFAYDRSRLFPVQIGEEVSDHSENGLGLTVGGGVEIPLSRRVLIRTEVRSVFIRRISGSIGLSYRW
jgi:opacity protein-like surface antigen